MFTLVAGRAGDVTPALLEGMVSGLRGGALRPERWRDPEGRAGAAASASGLLPEDVFDRQPLADDGNVFVCQARLDNRAELLRDLEVASSAAPLLPDSEVLWRCYRRWGETCVQRLVGDYAFAAWDGATGRVVAAIDHLASASLFYAWLGETIVLSSRLGGVLAHPGIARDLDLDALAALTTPRSLLGATPYRAVRSVPGGHLLIHDRAGLRVGRWWQPDDRVERHRDPRDYAARAGTLLEQAVASHLRTTGSIATTMSGGLDSTLVASMAARQLRASGSRITAYTSVPEPGLACARRPGWDESDWDLAAAVAALHRNMRHEAVAPGKLSPLDLMPALHAFSRTPVRNAANHVWLALISRRAALRGERVVLIGERGNAGLSASGIGAVEGLLREGRWASALRVTTELSRGERRATLGILGQAALGSRLLRLARGPRRSSRFSGIPFLAATMRDRVQHLVGDDFAGLSGRQMARAFLMRPRFAWAADPLAQWGVQWRDPLGDRRLLECLLSFPPEAFVPGGRYRGLARTLGEGLVPDVVRLRRTSGAQVPEHPSLIAVCAERYLRAVEAVEASILCRSMFDYARLRQAIGALREGALDVALASTVDRVLDVSLFAAAHEARG